jgi:DNA-binding transcriptional regulator YhcF (GntR family)
MFVADGAYQKIIKKRQTIFYKEVLPEIIQEADRLEITLEEIIDRIKEIKGGE